MKLNPQLLNKYDVPAPRYTSYPTVPYWSDHPSTQQWVDSLHTALSKDEASWSLYIHIPYCEQLCTFCGCNTSITRNHAREAPYVQLILKEWQSYLEKVEDFKKIPLKQIHLGGGTPTFLSVENLVNLVESIFKVVSINRDDFEASLEVDPRRTHGEQLQALYDMGFRRGEHGRSGF